MEPIKIKLTQDFQSKSILNRDIKHLKKCRIYTEQKVERKI